LVLTAPRVGFFFKGLPTHQYTLKAKAHGQNLLQINASPCLARTKVTASTIHWTLAFMATYLKQCSTCMETGEAFAIERITIAGKKLRVQLPGLKAKEEI